MDESDQNKIQEMQILEHNLQQILLQKQTFQIELTETQSAISEIEKSGEEVFKMIGQVMLKSDKNSILDELKNKERILSLRINSIEKQENLLTEKLEISRKEITDKLGNSNKNSS